MQILKINTTQMRRKPKHDYSEQNFEMDNRSSSKPANPITTTAGSNGAATGIPQKTIEEELSYPILISESLKKSATEAESFKPECHDLAVLADILLAKLRTAVRISSLSIHPLYDRPIRRIATECSRAVERGLGLSRRCRHGGGFLRRVVNTTIVGSAEFRKVSALLEASVADLTWLVELYKTSVGTSGADIVLGLPPVASNDPILAWVWSYIAVVIHGGSNPFERIDAVNSLSNLMRDNNRNKKIIIEEGGVPPLLALLKLKEAKFMDTQIAACNALINIANCKLGVSVILGEHAVPTIIHILSISPMKLQIKVAYLISTMAYHDSTAQEEFARENAIRPLVTLLSFDQPTDEPHVKAEIGGWSSPPSMPSEWHRRKEMQREKEPPKVKLELKVACAEALHKLSSKNVTNCRKITETKGLLSLAKVIEAENGILQYNCLMTLMEICASAECNDDLRRSAFKSNSHAAKLAETQLLRLAQQTSTPHLQIPAIRSIGYLAHTFTRKDNFVLPPLISQLSHFNPEVALQAAITLRKFTGPDNFNHVMHSKSVIEFGVVPPLMKMISSGNEKLQLNGLILVADLAINVGESESLEDSKVLATLGAACLTPLGQNPSLSELLHKAMCQLELYHSGGLDHRNLTNSFDVLDNT